MSDGLLNLSVVGYIVAALALTHVTIASVTIYLHRHQAHRALSLHPAVAHFFRLWLWLTTGMVTREWVAVHRKHHAKCESENDPHSPQQEGIWRVLFGGTFLYRHEAMIPETIAAYGAGTPDDWVEHKVYSRHRFLGLGVMLVADLLLFGGVAGAVIFAVQMVWIPFWAAGVINGVGHYWGYRNFETQDASRNIVPFGILIGGEELHNNHHAYGSSARLSNKWWELDIGWLYIRILASLGLATVRRTAPKTSFLAGSHVIDMEMLRAVVANRFHVLKLYGTEVVRPVLRAEARYLQGEAKRRIQRVRRLISKEHLALDAANRRHLKEALQANHTLQTIYEFRQRLKDLWTQQAKTQHEMLARLQAWCADAEGSGIAALEEFARQLRGYREQAA
ncbi:MAG TPA: fatty acid desaturase [Gammaproteobacteria bacterium]|nr:fatty acid desaturase [Gammaproteobacteria bacterium]